MTLHIDSKSLTEIKAILKANHLSDFAFAFGSRVRGDHQEFSDLDILIRASHALSIQQLAKLESAFSASKIPFKVDLVDWFLISEDFKAKIQQEMVSLKT